MASAQPSQDIQRGRDRQPPAMIGCTWPRHPSESRRLSDPGRRVKMMARKRDHFPGALHEGDLIRVFSRSADKWVDGEVVIFVEENFVRVEYEVGELLWRKTLHVYSNCLVIPSAAATVSEEDGDKQGPTASSSDFQSPSRPLLECASDPRWLLSCKYDVSRHLQRSQKVILIEQMLGKDLVSNPNRFSKTCCTIAGEVWDDNYNKGENADKYLRCWEPNAPKELQCSKPVASDQEPNSMTCWKASYFWRLERSRKMLRVTEGNELGEGQEIEKAMAEFLQTTGGGCKIRIVETGPGGFLGDYMIADKAWVISPRSNTKKKACEFMRDVNGPPEFFIEAVHLAPMLTNAGFGSPIAMALKVIKELDESCFPKLAWLLAARCWQTQLKGGIAGLTLEMYRAMPIMEKDKVREELVTKIQASMLADLKAFKALYPADVTGLDAFLRIAGGVTSR